MSKRIRVFATCDIGDALNILRNKGYDVEVYPRPEAPPKSLIVEKVKSGVDGLITTLRDPIDAEVFAAGAGTLKVVAQFAVGFDNISRAAANKYKVPFTNTADVLTEATAEFAFFMMGALARKLWPAEHLTRENRWGIKKCAGFDMNILSFDPAYENRDYIKAIQEMMDLSFQRGISREKTSIRYTTLHEALSGADFISLHVPLLREGESTTPTYHLINETTLRTMKPTAMIINTSRGPVIDEAALARALRENRIAGAALDVYEQEPLPADSPLRDPAIADRCRLLPHFASAARITRLSPDPNKGMAGRCVQGLLDVLEGNYGGDVTKMAYVVNKEAFKK